MIAYRSISLRLTAWFSAVFFAGLAMFGAVMWLNLKDTLTSGRSRTLERRVARLADLLRDTRLLSRDERELKFQAFAEATGGGLVEVFGAEGQRALRSPTASAHAFPWPQVSVRGVERFTEVQFQTQPYRVLVRPFQLGPERLVLCAAAPLESNRLVLNAFSAGLLWAIPALLAISALGGYVISRKALQPVDRITEAARSISVSNLSGRLPVPKTRDELQRLSETHNAMLARLESALNEIKQFTDDASHELRSPVAFMRTTAELALLNRQADPASRAAFEAIVAESGKASRLLKDMLTLARADAGNARLAFEAVDLREVAKTACQKARPLARQHGHALVESFDEQCAAMVWGDYASLQRLLWILLDNAIKYTPDGGSIKVSLSADEQHVTVAVEDNGMGIAAGDLPHIFGRFYRADPSRSQVEGSGLGLAIARWIAEVHHAALSAESREGEGSAFRVAVPLLAVSESQPRGNRVADSLHIG